MSAFLPQHDPNRLARESGLETARREYQYSYTHVSPLALLDRVPVRDEFSAGWVVHMGQRVLHALANRAELELFDAFRDYHKSHHGLLSHLLSSAETAIHGIKRVVGDFLKFEGRIGAAPVPAQVLDDYGRVFRAIGLPPVAKDYQDDRAFAAMRVAGPNPVMLRRLAARDDRLPVSDAEFAAVLPGDSPDAALAEGRAYLADYAALDGAEPGSYPHGRKYVYAPLALFAVNKATRALTPVAIQCGQRPGPGNPVFTPADGYNWLIAKTVVEVADGNVHEAATHLGRTHLFVEPFVISTYRQLAAAHPLAVLLRPHFEGTLAINEAAWKHLIATKGAVEKLFGASLAAARGLTAEGVRSHRVAESLPPLLFAARGVADPAALPDYPYRDDALLYWDAIREWVGAYLAVYYPADADVAADPEVQAWGRELAAADGGRLAGVPNDGAFATVAELADVVALAIFTCSVQHAAVNFPQYDLMSYVPRMPLAAYRPAPTTKSGATEADYLAMLPPLDMAELQMELGYLLGTMKYTKLGDYGEERFHDPRVAGPLAQFRGRVEAIGETIAARNLSRRPYEFLVPTGVPQSINV
ncbi:MAG: hypothetical protein K2X87_25280 [Gemmataceae bacterium]|nr:hypothetical protein [Gemmataceae bacterium]